MDKKKRKLHPLLRLAVISGVETAVRLHIHRGDDLDAQDGAGATPLILAAAKGNKSIVQMLLEAGATPDVYDVKGMCALDHAKASGRIEVISLLEQYRSDEIQSGLGADANSSGESKSCGYVVSVSQEANDAHEVDLLVQPALEIESIGKSSIDGEDPFGSLLPFDDSPLNDFDDSWKAEDEVTTPIGDASVIVSAVQVFETISHHTPVSSDEDWVDIELYLPERATPLQREGENDVVRSFLLTAIRHGFFTSSVLTDACSNDDGSPNEEAENILRFVAEELGSRCIEWNESESIEEDATYEENLMLDEAMDFAKSLASGWSDPFRFYSKEMKGELLTAKDEVALGVVMEEAGQDALLALAKCPEAIEFLYESAERVSLQEVDPERFSAGPEPSSGEDQRAEPLFESEEESSLNQASLDFLEAVDSVRAVDGEPEKMCEALAALRLRRGFLLEMAERAATNTNGMDARSALQRQAFARERMIRCNLRLAFSIARKYLRSGVPLDDLIQDANIGLMTAAERWDWRKGFRFSTYATWWIRQNVTRSIADKARLVRVPVHVHESARKLVREREDIEEKLGRPESVRETAKRTAMPIAKVKLLLSAFDEIKSLDEIDADSVIPSGEMLVDESVPDPADVVEFVSLRETLLMLVGRLDERSRNVVALRYGLTGKDPMTLEEIGQLYSLTRERIRQVESKAMRKLSLNSKREILAPFLNLENVYPSLHVKNDDDLDSSKKSSKSLSKRGRPRKADIVASEV